MGKKDLTLQVSTINSKWDIEKFFGDNNFGLSKVKMQAILILQKYEITLKSKTLMLIILKHEEKIETMDNARSKINMCLKDKC